MAEYNFWDDRTHEGNSDEYECPVIDCACPYQSDMNCENCPEEQAFTASFLSTEMKTLKEMNPNARTHTNPSN